MARDRHTSGLLSLDDLVALVDAGEVDTVVVGFADMQGRLVGKRVSSRLFMEEVASHGAECCNYLLAVDVEMNTVAGYAMSGWDRGYGDMVMRPDLSTLRLAPWLPGTALVMADLEWFDGSPVAAAPRSILQRQVDRLAERSLVPYAGTELEFMVFDDTFRDAFARAATTTSTTRCSARRGWSRCCATSAAGWRARGCTARAPRASATWASRRSRSATTTAW
jgi:glutamine synthetase